MGNCLRGNIESGDMFWGGDDWGSLDSTRKAKDTDGGLEKLGLLSDLHHHQMRRDHDHHDDHDRSTASGSGGGREVKIRISKKELEQLAGVQGLSMEQLLSHLIINGHDRPDAGPHLEHQRSWRPVLQSIPEVN